MRKRCIAALSLSALACAASVALAETPAAFPHVRGDEVLLWGPLTGAYFVGADSSNVVTVQMFSGGRVHLRSPGQWEGTGVLQDSTYWGVFEYDAHARDTRDRGARGTHRGTLDAQGRLHVRGTFINRDRPAFESVWTPSPGHITIGHDSAGVIVRHSITREELEKLPVDRIDGMHPVWPPPAQIDAGPGAEHPIWPPEWFKGDTHIRLAEPAAADALPVVLHRVAPVVSARADGRAEEFGGLVVVRALVETSGEVGGASIVRSVPGLDAAVLQAVKQWRFQPARSNGRPVPVWVYIPLQLAGL